MTTSILIATYAKDLPYLWLNLNTIRKFAVGFLDVVLVVPSAEIYQFKDTASAFRARLSPYTRPEDRGAWHLSAQCQKCWADVHCPGADFILHTDSDCIFTEPVTPDDYCVNGKPVMLYEEYSKLPGVPWKPVVEAVLKRPVQHEFMRRHPQVNPRGVYNDLRAHLESIHGMPFTQYVESRQGAYPWGFTEHNIIGAFAFDHPQWKDAYHWHNVTASGVPKEKLMQFWSHSDIDTPQEISHGGTFTPRRYTEKILK